MQKGHQFSELLINSLCGNNNQALVEYDGHGNEKVVLSQFFTTARWERSAVGQQLNVLGTQFGQGNMQEPSLKLKCPFNLYIIMSPAQYCALCEFPFKQMGACHAPDKSPLYAYLSILPYLLPFLYIILGLVLRSIPHLKVFAMLASGYIVGDKLCKPLFKSPRPDYSCKSSFGMPSSHMIVMATFAFYRIRESKHWAERVFWVAVTVAEGVSRMELNYHTLEQVIAGTAFGIVYALLFQNIWSKCEGYARSRWGEQKKVDGVDHEGKKQQ